MITAQSASFVTLPQYNKIILKISPVGKTSKQINNILHDSIDTSTVTFPHTTKSWLASNIPQLKTTNVIMYTSNTNNIILLFPQLLHPFNSLFPRTNWINWHQKGKPFWILMNQEIIGWQKHQLDHTQFICTSLQTDNHASTSSLISTKHI